MATKREKAKRQVRYSNAKEVAEKQAAGFEPGALNMPKGVQFFNWKDAKAYELDVIPYECKKTKHERGGNPFVEEEGTIHWERTYYIHKKIGPEEKSVACLAKSFGERCPVCEHSAKLRQAGDKKEADLLTPKRRQLFIFKDYADAEKGFQIHEGPYSNGFGELLVSKLEAATKKNRYREFFHLEDGKKVIVTVKKEPFKNESGGGTFLKPVNIEMEDRDEGYDLDILDTVPNLDECVRYIPYKQLKQLLEDGMMGPSSLSEDGDEDDKPAKKKPAKKKDEDEEEEETGDDVDEEITAEDMGIEKGSRVKHKKHGECEVFHVSGDGTSLRLRDEDGDEYKGIAPEDCEVIDEEEDEKPAKKKGAKAKPAKDEEDEEDEEKEESEDEEEESDDEEEEEPAKKSKTKKPAKKEEDDEDEPVWDEDEDEEEEEKPAKKKGKK